MQAMYQDALQTLKAAEARLLEDEKRFYALFQSVADYAIVLEFPKSGPPVIVDANEAAFEKHGYTREEMIGQPVTLIDRQVSEQQMLQARRQIQRGETVHFESVHTCKDGSTFTVDVATRRVEGENSRLFYTVERDITGRKRTEQQLRRTQFTVDHAAVGIVWVNRDGSYDYVNDEACRLLGYSREEFVGMRVGDINPQLNGEAWRSHFAETKATGFLSFESQTLRKDGTSLPLQVVVNHVNFDDREFHCTFLVDLREQKRAEQVLRTNLEETILAISKAVEARDPYTAGHQQRVSSLSLAIARQLGMDEERIKGIRMGAMIHDIGKIQTPAEILSKPGRLSEAEYLIIKEHPKTGYEILKDIHFPWPVAEIALQHHERIDGSGYPQGLKGGDICLEARIVAVADVVEAMGTHRPYRAGLGKDAALEEISGKKGTLYDPDVVDACLDIFAKGYEVD